MKKHARNVTIKTKGAGFTDVTKQIRGFVSESGIETGLLTFFLRHTSASLVIQENADPDVLKDLQNFFSRIAPHGGAYLHDTEGPDDMPAHIKAALTQTSLSIPVLDGAPALGIWQAVYVFEHRDQAHDRALVLHVIGD
jgi:secondary thiamine-phosphate synthase enzyme